MSDSASPLTSALEQLRLKLLDLTGRNRLINFKHTAGKSLQFVEGQITSGKDDFSNGIVNESRPLAQALLGAVVGDEVSLHLASSASKTFQIVEIVRSETLPKFN